MNIYNWFEQEGFFSMEDTEARIRCLYQFYMQVVSYEDNDLIANDEKERVKKTLELSEIGSRMNDMKEYWILYNICEMIFHRDFRHWSTILRTQPRTTTLRRLQSLHTGLVMLIDNIIYTITDDEEDEECPYTHLEKHWVNMCKLSTTFCDLFDNIEYGLMQDLVDYIMCDVFVELRNWGECEQANVLSRFYEQIMGYQLPIFWLGYGYEDVDIHLHPTYDYQDIDEEEIMMTHLNRAAPAA